MTETNAGPFGLLTPEKVADFYAKAEQMLALLKVLAAMTPTTVDDSAIAGLEKFLAATKPYVGEPWFINTLNFFLALVWKNEEGRKFLEKLA